MSLGITKYQITAFVIKILRVAQCNDTQYSAFSKMTFNIILTIKSFTLMDNIFTESKKDFTDLLSNLQFFYILLQ
jgi:hypothetical protein